MSGTVRRNRPAERSLAQIFAVPLALAVLTALGLAAALIGEGLWHAASWIALALPLVLAAWCLRPARSCRSGRA